MGPTGDIDRQAAVGRRPVVCRRDHGRDVLWMDRNPQDRRGQHDGAAGLMRLVAALRARRFERRAAAPQPHRRLRPHVSRHCRALWLRLRPAAPVPQPPSCPAHRRAAAAPLRSGDRLAGSCRHSHWTRTPMPMTASARLRSRPPRPIPWPRARRCRDRQLGTVQAMGRSRFRRTGDRPHRRRPDRLALAGGVAEAAMSTNPGPPPPPRSGGRHRLELRELAALAPGRVLRGQRYRDDEYGRGRGYPRHGLFGGTPPFRHNANIVPILPPDGRPDQASGMARITVSAGAGGDRLRSFGRDIGSGRAVNRDQRQAQPGVGPLSARTTW